MDRKARIREYKDTPVAMGVFQIISKANGKMLIGSSVNLPAILNRYKAELKMGSHPNKALQGDWNNFGPGNFEFNKLELLKIPDDAAHDPAKDLRVLEELWIKRLSPFGDKGYNKPPKAGTV